MKLYQFKTLSQQEQAEIIGRAQFFLFREEMKYTIVLYKVENFYVEAYYNNALKTIVSFNPFISKRRLQLYFDLQKN